MRLVVTITVSTVVRRYREDSEVDIGQGSSVPGRRPSADRYLSSVSLFMCVESNSGVADPGATAARPGTRVVEWLCAELPDCSSMLES